MAISKIKVVLDCNAMDEIAKEPRVLSAIIALIKMDKMLVLSCELLEEEY